MSARWSRDLIDQLRLVRTEGIGPITYRRLTERYPTPAAALAALPRLTRGSVPVVPSIADAERELAQTEAAGGRLVFLGKPDYPPLLALTEDAPPCLIVHGDLALAHAEAAIALVGGRNASANGQRMAQTLSAALAETVVVVSGLARGVDTAAHSGAMLTGRTIAVVAGGIDQPYPPENAALQRQIAETNLVLTEAPIGTIPQARHFPRRNRIIAGLSLGVVVVEAALRSGSLITTRLAQEAGREVFAVPGCPLDPRARGGNDLIRQGAFLVETAADVLANLPPRPISTPTWTPGPRQAVLPVKPAPTPPVGENDTCATILGLLSPNGTPVDDLVRRCQLSTSATMAVLLELELAGRVQTLPGNRVALLPDTAD